MEGKEGRGREGGGKEISFPYLVKSTVKTILLNSSSQTVFKFVQK